MGRGEGERGFSKPPPLLLGLRVRKRRERFSVVDPIRKQPPLGAHPPVPASAGEGVRGAREARWIWGEAPRGSRSAEVVL